MFISLLNTFEIFMQLMRLKLRDDLCLHVKNNEGVKDNLTMILKE